MTSLTCEALDVPQLVDGLIKVIPGLNRKLASSAFLCKKGGKVLWTVWMTILHVEGALSKLGLAVVAHKALRVEGLVESIRALSHDDRPAFGAAGRKKVRKVLFTVETTLLFDKVAVLEVDATVGVGANKVIGAKDFADGANEGSAYNHVA